MRHGYEIVLDSTLKSIQILRMRTKAPGHTIVQTSKQEPDGFISCALECTCGKVFLSKASAPDKVQETREAVYVEAHGNAAQHIAQWDEAVRTCIERRACAA